MSVSRHVTQSSNGAAAFFCFFDAIDVAAAAAIETATSFSAPLVASSRTRAADGGGAFARASPAGSPHSHSATSRLRMPFARATATVLQGAPKSSAAGAWGGTNGVTSEWVSKAQFLTCYGAIPERPSPRNPRHAVIRMAVTSE